MSRTNHAGSIENVLKVGIFAVIDLCHAVAILSHRSGDLKSFVYARLASFSL